MGFAGAPHAATAAAAGAVESNAGGGQRGDAGRDGTECETERILREAAEATCERDPQLACLGHWGRVALLNAWHTRLSVALQKGNAACILQAGRVRGGADLGGDTGWEEDIECSIRGAGELRWCSTT